MSLFEHLAGEPFARQVGIAASNSHGTAAVALNMDIQYLSAGQPGQRLVAEATEVDLTRRTALYRISVTDEESGKQVAALHARVYRLDHPVLPEA